MPMKWDAVGKIWEKIGDSVDFDSWSPGNPNGKGLQECAILERGQLNDKFCKSDFCHICQFNKVINIVLDSDYLLWLREAFTKIKR